MNRKSILFSATLLLGVGVWAQETKTYKETFNVGADAVLEINTSHADIEFDTWDKNQVEIVATVTLEGADEEDAKAYFEKDPIRIVGNSKEIEITTRTASSWHFGNLSGDFFNGDFDFNFDVEPFFLDLEIPDLPELAVIPELPMLPPMPTINFRSFDYDEYQREGSKYLEEWAKSFGEGFDEEYKERMKEWSERVEERAKVWEERNAKKLEERKERLEKRAEELEKRAEERARLLEERKQEMEEYQERRKELLGKRAESRRGRSGREPRIFYFSDDGENKKYKVKKTIKIKMPKSVRLKMNVKHGEVKLAAAAKNINASLRYASLLAATIEGENTTIRASYSPIVVQNWSLGQLKADYSNPITLKEVGELQFSGVSSDIVIDKLRNKVFATNNLGKLLINDIGPGFTDIDVSVQNGEVICILPSTPVSFYLNGTKSTIHYPSDLVMEHTKNYDTSVHKGFRGKDNSGKRITINSKYSDVVLKE